jgi:YegS/Rv2252/BmrU family lipid kinase
MPVTLVKEVTRYDDWIERYRQPVLIYNPYAGKIRRNRERILQATTAALAEAGVAAPRILPTDAAGHATALAREAAALGADLVLVLGGDGTLNEAANGLVKSGVALGVLPAGTANVLGMELGLGSRLPVALERLMSYEPRQIALGCLSTGREKRYFLCMAGAGLDAKIVTKVDPELKDRAGKLAYWAAGLSQFPERLDQFDICVNGHTYKCGFALASRVRNYGGDLEIASGASLKRDDFEMVLFEGTHPLRYVWYMVGVGLKQVQKMPGVRTLRAECADIVTSTHLQIDGEYAGFGRGRLEIEPGALTLLMPSTGKHS